MNRKLKVLVACEESQTVCIAFRALGHEAYSCDIQPCSGGHPEWHIRGDCIPLLDHDWDLVVAHPPCTYLTVTGNRWFNVGRYGDHARERERERERAAEFFMRFANCSCPHYAIENPIGCMSTRWRKPNQVIQPWQFGHTTCKATCLWLRGLPNLVPTKIVDPVRYAYVASNGKIKHDCRERSMYKASERAKGRSKTYQGIADAIADQWSRAILGEFSSEERGPSPFGRPVQMEFGI